MVATEAVATAVAKVVATVKVALELEEEVAKVEARDSGV